jgi:hypothetical protein
LFLLLSLIISSSCKKADVITEQATLNFLLTISESEPISNGFKYILKFDLTETSGVEITIDSVKIVVKKNNNALGQLTYNGQNVFSNNIISPYGTISSKRLIMTHDSAEFADSASIIICGNDVNGNSIICDGSATFEDLSKYPKINDFSANKNNVEVNETAILLWNTSNTTRVYIERNGKVEYDNLATSGTITISPTTSGTKWNNYVLYAINGSQSVKSEPKSITVNYPDIEYKVSGVKRANSITISGKGESTEQYSDITLPWHYKIQGVGSGDFVYVSAQSDMKSGCIKVEIYKNGSLWKKAKSCGKYVIATTSGTY